MQKALLGAAIALILVLVTALVGPLFVDWGRYRQTFQHEIARLTGSDVRIRGPIDVRLLPVPMLSMGEAEIGAPGGPAQVRAKALRVELALGPLMHGEFEASDVALESPEISVALGSAARPEQAASALAFDPGAVSVARLTIENGRLVVTGGPNGPIALERLEFSGTARSLLGPAKGEGSAVVGGEVYPFAIDAGRASATGAVSVRLRVDAADHARRGDLDGAVSIDQGVPRFAGSLRWSRTAGHSGQGFNEPWRLSAKVRADWAAAALDDVDLQYGAEDRAVQFRGRGAITFRAQPEVDVTLAAGKVDLDRMLALPANARRRPAAGVYAIADALGEAAPGVPVTIGLTANAVTLADATLERVSIRLSGKANAWDLDSLDVQAPGGATVQLRGHVDRTPKGTIAFEGEGRVETRDARPLATWLADGAGGDAFAAPFRAAARVRFSGDGVSFDRLNASLDRDTVEGAVAYDAAGSGHGARMSATLRASAIDVDRAWGLIQRMAGDAGAAWPREGSLSLNAGTASAGGVEVKGADVSLRFTERALTVDRLSIDDVAGSRLAAAGSVDIRTLAPRGAITFDLDVGAADAVAAAVEKFSAPAAAALHSATMGRLLPASLHGVIGGDAQAARAAGIPDGASFSVDGSAGPFWFDMKGAMELPPAAGSPSFARIAPSKIAVAGNVDVRDGRTLLEAAGLDRLLSVNDRTGRVDFWVSGRPDGPMTTTAQVTAGGLDASLNGTLQVGQGQISNADLGVSVALADVRVAQAGTLPARFAGRMSYAAGAALGLDQIAGTIAGIDIAGRVAIGLAPVVRLDGDIRLGAVDIAAITAAAVGAPAKRAGKWSAEPFAGGVLGQYRGRLALSSPQALLTPGLAAGNLRGVLNFGPSDIALDDIEADMAGGRVSGRIAFERDGGDVGVKSRLRLTKADISALAPGQWPLDSGRLDLDSDLEGRGRSPAALIGSLRGKSAFHIENGRLAQLDPAAFDAVIRSVDQEGLPIEAARIRERAEAALARGALPVQADGAVTAADGKVRLAITRLQAEGADLTMSARYDLPADALDAKLTLAGPARAADTGRPEIAVSLQGPLDAPRRTLDVAALSGWLSMRAANENAKRLAAALARPDDARPPPSVQPVAPLPPHLIAPSQLPASQLADERKKAEEQRLADERKRAEEQRLADERKKAEAQRLADERKKVEEQRLADERKRAEEQRLADERKRAEEQRLADERKRAEEQRFADERKRAEEQRFADERKRAEEQRLADERKKVEEQRLADERKRAEEQRLADERKRAEEQRLADERKRAEEQRLADERKKAEEQRLADERRMAEAAPPVSTLPVPAPPAARPPAELRMAELDRTIAANPHDGAALAQRGEMFALRRDYGAAIKDFDEVIRLRPRDADALNNRCWARAVVGDLAAALSDCNASLQLRPRNADAFDSRGMINLKSGRLGEAITDFDAALQINPKLASSLYGRGLARIKTGNAAGGNLDIAGAKAIQPNIAAEFAGYGIR
jgi:uncharacterized protein involved in outer membrane biogenesis